jgi:hypothetical protein
VLWVDDEREEVCVAALTTSGTFKGAINVSHPQGKPSWIASWVTIQETKRLERVPVVGHLVSTERARITAALRDNLGLDG